MNRRGFLKGSVAALAVGASGIGVLPVAEPSTVVMTLDDYMTRIVRQMVEKFEHTIIYGNPEYAPMQFTGLRLFQDCPNEA